MSSTRDIEIHQFLTGDKDRARYFAPADLGLASVDLTALGSTDSEIISLGGIRGAMLETQITIVGAATVGDFNIQAAILDADDAILGSMTMHALNDTSSATNRLLVIPNEAPLVSGGTVSTGARLFYCIPKMRIRVNVATASDAATSAVADLRLWIVK